MALTLTQRLIAAKKPHARLADNEKLLADLKTEQGKLGDARDRAAAESVDFALSEDDREEEAAKAGRYERTLKGLETEIAELETIIAERRDSEAAQRADAEKAAIREERDKLAVEFSDKVPGLVDQLIDLFGRVNANAARLIAIGDRDGCAEAKARGLKGFIDPYGPKQFTKMQIPAFHGRERAWPPAESAPAAVFDYAKQIENARRQREQEIERKQQEAADYARNHARYQVATKFADFSAVEIPAQLRAREASLPMVVSNGMPWVGMLPHTIAAELREISTLKVDLFDKGKR